MDYLQFKVELEMMGISTFENDDNYDTYLDKAYLNSNLIQGHEKDFYITSS